MVFHSAWSALIASAVGDPVGRLRERFGTLAERELPLQVFAARLRLRFEEGVRAAAHLVDRRLEPPPQHLALVPRPGGNLLPLLLEIAELPCRVGGILHGTERLGFCDQLLLHARVGPALPLVCVAELLHAGPERRARRFQTLPDGIAIGAVRQVLERAERFPRIPQHAVERLERRIRRRDDPFRRIRRVDRARKRVPLLACSRLPHLLLACLNRPLDRGPARCQRRDALVSLQGFTDCAPFVAQPFQLTAAFRPFHELRIGRQRLRLRTERFEPLQLFFHHLRLASAGLGGPAGRLEPRDEPRVVSARKRSRCLPVCTDAGQRGRNLRGRQRGHPRHQCFTGGDLTCALGGELFARRALRLVARKAVAHRRHCGAEPTRQLGVSVLADAAPALFRGVEQKSGPMPVGRGHERLDVTAQVTLRPATLLDGGQALDLGFGRGGSLFLEPAEHRASAALGRRILRAGGDRAQRLRIGDALDSSERHVLVVRLQGRRGQLLRVRKACERGQASIPPTRHGAPWCQARAAHPATGRARGGSRLDGAPSSRRARAASAHQRPARR